MGGRSWVTPGISSKAKEALVNTNPSAMVQSVGRSIQISLKGNSSGAAQDIFSFVICLLEREGLPLALAPEGVSLGIHEWRPFDGGADKRIMVEGLDICLANEQEVQLLHRLFHAKPVRIGQQFRTLVISDPVLTASSAKKAGSAEGPLSPPSPSA